MVVGRDARTSGPLVDSLVCSTLNSLGIDVVNGGLATTPSVELAAEQYGAIGGIIITASHNPGQWNALKLLNRHGEFISGREGEEVLLMADHGTFDFVPAIRLGTIRHEDFLPGHISSILALPEVDGPAIAAAGISVAVDAVNSVGGFAIPALLKALGVRETVLVNCVPDGNFAHNPEPLPEHLSELSAQVVKSRAHMGIAVDPDVDRLAFVCEDGSFFGEEYTLVAIADFMLAKTPGNTVSNLSSSRALRIVTEKHGGSYMATPVGEVHVVTGMKKTGAILGGEGNGGVIFPALHYGRDSLVGLALFLTGFATAGKPMTAIRASLPAFEMAKMKIDLPASTDINRILEEIDRLYSRFPRDHSDGLKIDFPEGWVHLRKSNTEPIIRIYAEAADQHAAEAFASRIVREILDFVKNC
jgi:phosphomannomutase